MSHELYHVLEANKKMFVAHDFIYLLDKLGIKSAARAFSEPEIVHYVERQFGDELRNFPGGF